MIANSPSRVRIDRAALVNNWRWLSKMSGAAACGAAVKADGYGLGARGVVDALAAAGCRDFFVATWGEAHALGALPEGASLSVLHGVREADMAYALSSQARPTLNSVAQVMRWKAAGGGICDVMVDTGMNRLGISEQHIADGLLDGLAIDTLMSHLASADEDVPLNAEQRNRFAALAGVTNAKRMSLANSAGICLGTDFAFDLTRPGLALYGGIARDEAQAHIVQVAYPEAQVLQIRMLRAGGSIGYNQMLTAANDTNVAILNIGYADGYLRGFSSTDQRPKGGGVRFANGTTGRVLGRVSMDLIAVSCDAAGDLSEGDWVSIDYHLATAAAISGLSQYELLTGLGQRLERVWV